MSQFFVRPQQIQGRQILIEGPDVNHIKNVLRMKPGEELSVVNGIDGKEYRCEIERIEDETIYCTLRFIKEDGLELPAKIYLFQGIPKSDKMEWIIQKAVELGVFEIVPVAAKRCVVKLNDKKEKSKLLRWQGISESAAKQSRRRMIPVIHEPMDFREAVQYAKELDLVLIPYELAEDMEQTRRMIEKISPGMKVGFFIGPEGGFEEQEIHLAMEQGIIPVTLGRRILRTETAGLTVLSWIMYQLEGKDIK